MVHLTDADQMTICRTGDDVLICLGPPKGDGGKIMITLPMSRLADLTTPLTMIQLAESLNDLGGGLEKLGAIMHRAIDSVNLARAAEQEAADDTDDGRDAKVVQLHPVKS